MTGRIPKDATLWDSGDWIEWHRGVSNVDAKPRPSAARDRQAELTALRVGMLESARQFYKLTGDHLPIYQAIAEVYAATIFEFPPQTAKNFRTHPDVQILHIPPHGPDNIVHVDLNEPFSMLVVVRIKDNFTCEARMITRGQLPEATSRTLKLRWQALPKRD